MAICVKKAMRAKRSQDVFFTISAVNEALPYPATASNEATNATITKKCPTCPGSKCSPSNGIRFCFLFFYTCCNKLYLH